MLRALLLASAASLFSLSAVPSWAETHRVWAESTAVVEAGEAAWRVDVYYGSMGALQQSSGLGLRVHYDSTALTLLGNEDVFAEGLIGSDSQAMSDDEDLDRDQRTDVYLGLAWGDLRGAWPSQSSVRLASLLFKRDVNSTEPTTLRFSSSALSPGWSLSTAPLRID